MSNPSLDPVLLRQLIKRTLTPLNLYSADAEELLMATCAQESLLGKYRHQVNGPAIGIFQDEPGDFNDLWAHYLSGTSLSGVTLDSMSGCSVSGLFPVVAEE